MHFNDGILDREKAYFRTGSSLKTKLLSAALRHLRRPTAFTRLVRTNTWPTLGLEDKEKT